MVWALSPGPALPAFLFLVVMGVVLAAVDARHELLPNRLVLPLLAGAAALLAVASALSGTWLRFLAGLLGAAALFAVYLVLALIKTGALGMGDVKLAAVIGLYAGYLGFRAWLFVLLGAFIINALAILALLLRRGARPAATIPFGPSMLAAALLLPLAG
jgi:leader peptidase (prepilin peptidase)/N-methyltransferase